MAYEERLQKIIDFHGHICPGMVYGYRVARTAMELLGDRAADEEIVAIVENDSCSVDAIQVMTGCTFGKGNLIFHDYGKQAYTFFKRSTGEGLRISVDYTAEESPEEKALWKKFSSGDRSTEVVNKVRELKARKVSELLSAPDDALLKIRKVAVPPPPKARIYPSIRCEKCGEKAMEPRLIIKQEKKLCIPCSES